MENNWFLVVLMEISCLTMGCGGNNGGRELVIQEENDLFISTDIGCEHVSCGGGGHCYLGTIYEYPYGGMCLYECETSHDIATCFSGECGLSGCLEDESFLASLPESGELLFDAIISISSYLDDNFTLEIPEYYPSFGYALTRLTISAPIGEVKSTLVNDGLRVREYVFGEDQLYLTINGREIATESSSLFLVQIKDYRSYNTHLISVGGLIIRPNSEVVNKFGLYWVGFPVFLGNGDSVIDAAIVGDKDRIFALLNEDNE